MGVSLKYLEQGQGTPVVFVHSDHRIWEPEREVIAQRYRFIALSLRYFGTDRWPDDGTKGTLQRQCSTTWERLYGRSRNCCATENIRTTMRYTHVGY
jgi:hypothetical protein